MTLTPFKKGNKQIFKRKVTSYPKYHLTFTVDGKVVNSLWTRKPLRILFRIRLFGAKFKSFKAFLGFYYTPKYCNEGFYTSKHSLEHAYRCFYELLDEFKGE